jgi:hypothetical protein
MKDIKFLKLNIILIITNFNEATHHYSSEWDSQHQNAKRREIAIRGEAGRRESEVYRGRDNLDGAVPDACPVAELRRHLQGEDRRQAKGWISEKAKRRYERCR